MGEYDQTLPHNAQDMDRQRELDLIDESFGTDESLT